MYKRKTKDVFIIYGKYFLMPFEEIDTADTLSEARYLEREYEMAFGGGLVYFHQEKEGAR